MTIRVYIMPSIDVRLAGAETAHWHPKYLYPSLEAGAVKVAFQCKRFGDVDNTLRLVFADVTQTQHTALKSFSGVISFPANLTNSVGANLVTAKTQLRALGIPAKRLQATHTWKQIIKHLVNHTESMKTLHKDNIKDFIANNLDTLLVDLPQNVKDKITTYLANHNIDVTLTAGMDVEDLLHELADKIPAIHKVYGETY